MTTVMKCIVTCQGEKRKRVSDRYQLVQKPTCRDLQLMLKFQFVQTVDNKVDPAGVVEYAKLHATYKDPKVQQSVNEIIEECKSITNPDRQSQFFLFLFEMIILNFRCEFGSKVRECFAAGATKHKIAQGLFY